MIRLHVQELVMLANVGGKLVGLSATRQPADTQQVGEPTADPEKLGPFEVLARHCKEVGMNASAATARRLIAAVRAGGTFLDHRDILDELQKRLYDELQGMHVWTISPHKHYLLESHTGSWKGIGDSFPSAIPDLEEAVRCFALDRFTACVFHSMRAVEVLLRILAKRQGIKGDIFSTNAQNIIDQINANLRTRKAALRFGKKNKRPSAIRSADQKIERDAALVLRLESFKDAWRNNVAHAKTVYTEEPALRIYTAVHGVLIDASAFLSEASRKGKGTP